MSRKLASHRIYVDVEGNVVEESDPAAAFLAVAEGQPIPDHITVANGNRVIIEIDDPEEDTAGDSDGSDDKPAPAAKKSTKRKGGAKKATKSEASEPEVATDGGE